MCITTVLYYNAIAHCAGSPVTADLYTKALVSVCYRRTIHVTFNQRDYAVSQNRADRHTVVRSPKWRYVYVYGQSFFILSKSHGVLL